MHTTMDDLNDEDTASIYFNVVRGLTWIASTILLLILNVLCLIVLAKTSEVNEIIEVFLISMTVSDLGIAAFYTLPAICVSFLKGA